MVDFFKFKESLEEAKAKQAKKPSEVYEDELEKDADDPCWEGYVQLGTKMVDGKEVPNCVPMEEAAKQVREKLEKDADDPCQAGWVQLGMKTKNGRQVPNCVPLDEARKKMKNEADTSYEDDIDPNKKIVVKGTKGMNSKSFTKKFRNMKAADKWMDDNEDDIEIKQVMNESTLVEGHYDAPDYGPAGAADMAHTQLHFIMYAAEDIMNCVRKGCPMPEWYQNKLAKLEGDMEGLYSYMKGKTRKMQAHQSNRYGMMGVGRGMYEQTLTEAKSGDKEAYQKFFNKALKKFGVDSPTELEGDKEKEFYDYVDKNWKSDNEKNESYINEVLKPSDDVSKWIEDFRASDAPQFKGKDKEERREMAVAAWLDARREAGYDVGPNPNE